MTQKDFAETTPYTRKLMVRYLGESCVHSSIRCAKAYLNDIVRIECVFLSYENARKWGNDVTAEQTTDKYTVLAYNSRGVLHFGYSKDFTDKTDANAYFQMLIHTVGKNWRKEVKEAV